MSSPDKFNSTGGYSVGIPPRDVIDGNLNISANAVVATSITSPVFFGDLVGNVIGSVNALAAVHYSLTPPPSPIEGSLWFDLSTMELKLYTGSMWITIFTSTPKQITERYEFGTSLRWVIQHNKNTIRFREYAMDSDGRRIYAQTQIIDSNSFEIVLTDATAGSVEVSFD